MVLRTQLMITEEEKIKLAITVKNILGGKKGILAADEKEETLQKRFSPLNIPNTPENRAKFRELLFKTEGIEQFIGGVILNEETFENRDASHRLLVDYLADKKLEIGVKLDKGLIPYGQETISIGLEDLEQRIKDKKFEKCTFAKWRSLFKINDQFPTQDCINANVSVLSKYAVICQKNGLVPILEPEIFYEGNYDENQMKNLAKNIYSSLYCQLNKRNVFIKGTILKVSFISAGKNYLQENIDLMSDSHLLHIGNLNVGVLSDTIPSSGQNVVFLSGGHSNKESLEYLAAANRDIGKNSLILSFSYGRALTDSVLRIWKGNDENKAKAQQELLKLAKLYHEANKSK
jgi:fructose-bisphosphate aldolase, class I